MRGFSGNYNQVTIMFSSPHASTLKGLQRELRNYDTPGHLCSKVISCEGKLWYVKTLKKGRSAKRELLGYLLGNGLVNVAEVRSVNETELLQIKKIAELDNNASPNNTVLVKLACDYTLDELPLQELNIAAAGELVFSVWVRRRDAHLFNRAYVDNIPMFFDHHVAFGLEPYLLNLKYFFRSKFPGNAGAWRIQEHDIQAPLNTTSLRRNVWANSKKWDTHYIDCPKKFTAAVKKIASVITDKKLNLRSLIHQAGFRGIEALILLFFLKRSTKSLHEDVALMLDVVTAKDSSSSIIREQ